MGYRLGIDLGTTFTAAAYVEDASPRMLELGNRNLTVPSVLFVADDGGLLFGETAERRASAEPERVLREFKRRIGDTVPMVAGGRTFDPVALQSEFLSWVLQAAGDRLAGPPEHVVVTHPANWGLFKIQLMRDIAAAAGVSTVSLCAEPVAAAIEYAAKQAVPVGAKVAIYDLGGGTFDVAVLEKSDDGFAIIGTPLGVEHLGGSDFDEAVLADAASKLGLHGIDPDDPAIARGLAALRRECIEAKESLSSDVATEITSLLPGAARSVRLTRGELERLIRPALDESIRTTSRALRLAGVNASDLHAIVLVGGSSRIPLVTELLTHEFGVPVASDTFPKHDIALGAARYARLHGSALNDSVVGAATPIRVPQMHSTDSAEPAASVARGPASPAGPHALPTPANPPRTSVVREQSRRRIPVGLVVAIIVICLAAGAGIVTYRVRSNADRQADPASQSSALPSVQVPTTTIDQEVLDLPVGSPLPATHLIAPRYAKSGAQAQLWLIDSVDPSASRHLEALQGGSAYAVGMSPDRRTITYIDSGANALRAMPASGGTGRRLFASPNGCGRIHHASWSPTDLGVFVLECQLNSGPRRLAVVNLDGKIIHELDTDHRHSSDPTISPDGTEVAFWATDAQSDVEGGSIFVMPIDGSAPPRPLTDSPVSVDSDPAWSPDGTSVAYRRRVGDPGRAEIRVVSATGGAPRTLVNDSAANQKPTWSPDGRTIVFVSNRDSDGSPTDRSDLWFVAAAGGEPTALGLSTHQYATPTWWHR